MSTSSWISAGLRTVADYFGEEEQEDENLTIVHDHDDERQEYENRHAGKAAVKHPDDTTGKRKTAAGASTTTDFHQKKMRLKETAVNIHGSRKTDDDANVEEKLDPSFKEKLNELKAHIAKYGHMNVSCHNNNKDRALGEWIEIQCFRRKAMPKCYNSHRAMTQSEMDALDAIGFDWEESLERRAATFRRNFALLKAFKAKHNHTDVPYSRADGKQNSLYSWVHTQRMLGSTFPKPYYESRAAMTQEEKGALDSIGFSWEPPAVKRNPYFWERVDELKKFKEKHGNLDVKKSKNKKLYDFCCNQKMRYVCWPRGYGRNRPMSEEEKDALDAVGFTVWVQR